MRRQPVATADSAFVLGDNTMQCPSGSEPVHNIEDCLTYVAGSQTFTNDVSERFSSEMFCQMGACITEPHDHTELHYNAYHHLSGRYPDLSTRVPALNQETYRVVCRLLAAAPTAAPSLTPTAAPSLTPTATPSLTPTAAPTRHRQRHLAWHRQMWTCFHKVPQIQVSLPRI